MSVATSSNLALEALSLFVFLVPNEEDRFTLKIHHDGHIRVPFAKAELVDHDDFHIFEFGLAGLTLVGTFVDVSNHQLADFQKSVNALKRHYRPQVLNQPDEAVRVIAPGNDFGLRHRLGTSAGSESQARRLNE